MALSGVPEIAKNIPITALTRLIYVGITDMLKKPIISVTTHFRFNSTDTRNDIIKRVTSQQVSLACMPVLIDLHKKMIQPLENKRNKWYNDTLSDLTPVMSGRLY